MPQERAVVMELHGVVSQGALPLLGGALELVLERRPESLLVDCGQVEVPATSQLAALVDIVERSHERGIPCSLVRLTRLQVLLLRRWWPQVDPSDFEEANAREASGAAGVQVRLTPRPATSPAEAHRRTGRRSGGAKKRAAQSAIGIPV